MKHYFWNMMTSIQNGQMAKKKRLEFPRKNVIEKALKILWVEGFILGYSICTHNPKKLNIFLKYTGLGVPAIKSIRFISKPGRRVYLSTEQVWKMSLNNNTALFLFSTDKGLLSMENCKKLKVGGELLVIVI